MSWFRFRLADDCDVDLAPVLAIPGASYKGGRSIVCHSNCAWLVREAMDGIGAEYDVTIERRDGHPLTSIDQLVPHGLREWVPEYLTPYQREGVLATAHRDAHLWWAAGCLTGETVVWVRRKHSSRPMRLKDVVSGVNGRWMWPEETQVLSVDEVLKVPVWNRLTAAVASGVKEVFHLKVVGGSIRATADHRFLTTKGWRRLAQLRPGVDQLIWAEPLRLNIRDGWDVCPRAIESIASAGEEETFDLSMAAPHHNFIANGIVVHNSGKTLGAICWSLASPGRTVMVTRAGVRRSHGREIERYTYHRALVIESKEDAEALKGTDALYAVVGWEMLPDLVAPLLQWKPQNLIADELHRSKSPKRWAATATSDGKVAFSPRENIAFAIYQLSRAVRRRLGTTATPIKDRTRDLWAQLDLIHPDAWGRFYASDKASFAGRYCAARDGLYGGIDTSGASNLEELWKRVSFVVDQVPHSVTHRHLPARRRIVTYVTPAEQCRAEGFTKTFFKHAAKGGSTGLLEARLMEAAAKKRKVLLELVEEAVAGGQKVVIFTGRREDCDRLGEDVTELVGTKGRVFVGHGGTSAADRDGIQQAYMADPGPCVLVGTGDAWGEGVSLHDSDLALIAMLPYTPGAIVQWEGRFSRQGQKRPVLIQYLVAEGTVDEHVVELLLGKLRPVEEVSHDDSIEGFADSLRGADEEEAIVASILGKLGG